MGEREGGEVAREGYRRFWDVDVARGVAMIMVVLYHLVFDLDNFAGYGIESTSGFWALFADVSASAFLLLVGLSLAISSERERRAGRRGLDLFGKYARRGARVFLYGMLITVVFLALGYGYVIFGILHLIGLSIVLAYPLLGRRIPTLLLGLAVVAAGAYLRAAGLSAPGAAGILLAPLGILPEGLFMPDYRPLLPWLGVVLLGLFFGNAAYVPWRGKTAAAKGPPYAAPLAFLGRHTLLVYLVHQPVLIATLWALGVVSF